ncbi:MAG: hypothetical protein RLZZ450_835 [Pseudomonadota bacterium]|jgi:hypothetical protein
MSELSRRLRAMAFVSTLVACLADIVSRRTCLEVVWASDEGLLGGAIRCATQPSEPWTGVLAGVSTGVFLCLFVSLRFPPQGEVQASSLAKAEETNNLGAGS